MPVGWAALGGAVVSAGAGMSASNKASKAQQQAAQAALDEQRNQFASSRADSAPYREVGTSAINRLSDLFNLDRSSGLSAPNRESYIRQVGDPGNTMAGNIYDAADPAHKFAMDTLPGVSSLFGKKKKAPDTYFDDAGYNGAMQKYNSDLQAFNNRERGMSLFEKDPGYNFRMDQGITAMDRSANARGVGLSGGTLQALNRYNQDYASNEFGNYVNRLSSLAGIGQSSSNASANLGAGMANNMSSILQNEGNNRANAYQSSYGALNNAVQGGLNNYSFQQYMNKPPTTSGMTASNPNALDYNLASPYMGQFGGGLY